MNWGIMCSICCTFLDAQGQCVCTRSAPTDSINPAHYRSHPEGIECIQVTRYMSFNLGNVVKYLWRGAEGGRADDRGFEEGSLVSG
jgi:hypothetical protein